MRASSYAARPVGVGPARRARARVRGFGGNKRADGRAVHLDGEVREGRRGRREAGGRVSQKERRTWGILHVQILSFSSSRGKHDAVRDLAVGR